MSLLSLLTDVIFVGHSLVGPNLPPMVEAALRRMQAPAEVSAQIINGAPLRYNWENSATAEGVDARAELAKGQTEALIVTEAIPLKEHIRHNDTAGQIAAFAILARSVNPDVRVFLYETWHPLTSGPGQVRDGDADAGIPWRDRLTADLPLWEASARDAAARPGAGPVMLIPAGQAMGLLADEIAAGRVPGVTGIGQFFEDEIHPNGRGLYFLALVHAAAITGKSPEGLPAKLMRSWPSRAAVIADDLAPVLQRIAWQAVSGYKPPEVAAAAVAKPDPVAAAVPDPAKAAAFAPITNPALSLGLAGVHDWSVQQPFLDVMKTARPWIGHLPGQWGGWDHARLAGAGALDANGWPAMVPPDLTGIGTLILTDLPAGAGGVAGRYVLTHDGGGTLRVEGRVSAVDAEPGRILFDFTPGDGGVLLTIAATDPADPISNISVVRADRAGLLAAGAIFNPDWLARIRGVQGVRFMDWMATNNSALIHAEDRPRPADYTWARVGVPAEVMVALANELDADPWFTLPHQAEDALVRTYARIVHDELEPGLVASVEYSNEVWNWQFQQAAWADAQGRARWNRDDTWVQFYALRAAEVAGIWADVFGTDAPDRLIRVVATQTGWLGLEDLILAPPLADADREARPVSDMFDAYAVAFYLGGHLGQEARAPQIRDWLATSQAGAEAAATALGLTGTAATDHVAAHRFDAASALAIADLRGGTSDEADTLARFAATLLPHHRAVAARYGLDLVMYEGGTHVVGMGPAVEDAALTDFFTHLNYTPEMAVLYTDMMAAWAAVTDAPFNAFVDVFTPGRYGSWGALRHLTDENPRWLALASGCAAC